MAPLNRAIIISLSLHIVFVVGVFWSTHLSLLMLKARRHEFEKLGAIKMEISLYKPTDSPMKQGPSEKDLPPPIVKSAPQKEPELVFKEKTPKTKPKPKPKKEEKPKQKLSSILDRIRAEAGREERPPPKENNFPTIETGEKQATGTGSIGDRNASPAEQALQSAITKYFDTFDLRIKKKFPNAEGFMIAKIVGVGDQFEILSLTMIKSSGIQIVDQNCLIATRQALKNEVFAPDVISDLSGKEVSIQCKP